MQDLMWFRSKLLFTKFPNPQHLNPFVRPQGDKRPIDKLPVELLARIFELASAQSDRKCYELFTSSVYDFLERAAYVDPELWPTSGRSPPPGEGMSIIVSHVCHHWRDIAISTPTMWTDIRVSPDTTLPPYRTLSLYLERSANLPIEIHITTFRKESGGPDAGPGSNPALSFSDLRLLCSLLVPHVSRCRSIEITGEATHTRCFLDAVSHPSTPPASQLVSLRLRFYDTTAQTDPAQRQFPILFNGLAPQLEDVVLSGVHMDWNQTWISSASNLTSLQLMLHHEAVRPSWTQFATILRGAPALKKLALYISGPAGPPDEWGPEPTSMDSTVDPFAPIQLLHLTDLVLGLLEDLAISLLRRLYMPVLTGLVLDSAGNDYTNLIADLVWPETTPLSLEDEDDTGSLLNRLERLAILGLACDKDMISFMFEELTNLTTFRIEIPRARDSLFFLELLSEPTLLPNLEHLFAPKGRRRISLLREIVQGRIDEGTPLKSLYLPWDEMYCMREQDQVWFGARLERVSPVSRVYFWNTDLAFETEWIE